MALPFRRAAASLIVSALLGCGVFEPSTTNLVGCVPEFEPLEQSTAAELAGYGVNDAALLVRLEGRTVCRLFFGTYGPATQVPTASAAKWLSAATLLGVVEQGKLRLDSRTGDLFPTTQPATAPITVSQLLSHTSGLLWFSRCMGRREYTLQSCAEQILDGDLHFDPGTGFFYSGPPFTVAGAMAERATGLTWDRLFREVLADPLEMDRTTYGDNPNPALSEGEVVSTLDDYSRFAQMILDRGRYRGRPVLSESAITEMRRQWNAGVPVVSSPRDDLPYGLGAWLDSVDEEGNGVVLSSPGIGGFVPVVDFSRRMVFVFVTQNDLDRLWPTVMALLTQARAITDAKP